MKQLSKVCLPILALLLGIAAAPGCQKKPAEGAYDAAGRINGLPDVTLLDKEGRQVALASFRGKPVLVDFIYAGCSGPCPLLTEKFVKVAGQLGPRLGREVTLLSFTLDPEHDHPAELKQYAEAHSASHPGWYFLSGTPAQMEAVLKAYGLKREREPDGSITHMVASFLLGADGYQVRQYNALRVSPQTIASEIADLASKRG